MSGLDETRSTIGFLDGVLVECLRARGWLTRGVVEDKRRAGVPVRDDRQRQEVLRRAVYLAREAGVPYDEQTIREVFTAILDGAERL